jgi:putative transposase
MITENLILPEDPSNEATAAENPVNLPKTEEFKVHQLEKIAQNYLLVCRMENGESARAAIKALGLNCSERRARNVFKKYKEKGFAGLVDKRWLRMPAPSVLTPLVKKIVLAWWFARPAAGPKAIWDEVVKACKKLGLREPGYDSVKKFIEGLPEHYKLIREGKIDVWDKQNRPVVRIDITKYSNERWQLDHCRLDIWIRIKVNGYWIASQAHITVALDAQSRSIPGYILSTKYPDAWTDALLLRKSILPKENPQWKNRGIPAIVQPDRGTDFMSHAIISTLAKLHVIHDPDPPYYPNNKGKVERWFLTLDVGCLRILPGHMKAIGTTKEAAQKHVNVLLTLPQLKKEVERWIVEVYHQRIHSETGRKPSELWEETVRLRMPESEEELDSFLLKSDKNRTIMKLGVRFGEKCGEGLYWAPGLVDYVGAKVQIRYNPEDGESILVYEADTVKYICEAWLMGQEDSRYNIEDIKRERNRFRRGLRERMKDYAREIELEDRRSAQQAEWNEARRKADTMATEPAGDDSDNDIKNSEEVERLITEFERRDRGNA